MDIINFDIEKRETKHHHWLLPASIRCVVVGPSECGKTNMLLNLLLRPGYLKYDRIHLYSKSLGQEKYRFLSDWASDLSKAAGKEIASFHSSADDIIPVEKLNPKERTIMVFDDCMQEKQGPIESYYCQGRHGGADCFYLTQNYFKIPRQAIRCNCNMFVLFNIDTKDLRTIHDAFAGGDMPFDEFRKFFSECTREKHGFAVMDLTSEAHDGKYRKGFDTFYIPKSSI